MVNACDYVREGFMLYDVDDFGIKKLHFPRPDFSTLNTIPISINVGPMFSGSFTWYITTIK